MKSGFQRKYFFATFGAGLGVLSVMYSTARGLSMSTTITREVPFLKKLFITTQGDFSSTHIIDVDENGIRLYNAPLNNNLLLAPNGQFVFEDKYTSGAFGPRIIGGAQIASGSLEITDFGIPIIQLVSNLVTGSCAGGQVMNGVINNVPTCTSIVAANSSCGAGGIQGVTSTGWLICGGTMGNASTGTEQWHIVSSTATDIFYGTRADDNNGNVGIGFSGPIAKLHIQEMGSGLGIYLPSILIVTGGFTTYPTKACPYLSSVAITSPLCVRHNGLCGASNGQNFATAPTTNLCAAGTPSGVGGSGPWTWSCYGINGGTSSSTCTAIKKFNGACGSANGVAYREAPTTAQRCNLGNAVMTNTYAGGGSYYEQWYCQGVNGGSNSPTCTGYPITVGECGPYAQIANYSANPINGSANLCGGSIGSMVGAIVVNYATLYTNPVTKTWTCQGYNGGPASAQCKTEYSGYPNPSDKRLHAECGTITQSSTNFTSAPTSNLCGNLTPATMVGGSMTTVSAPAGFQWYRRTCQAANKNDSYCYVKKQ